MDFRPPIHVLIKFSVIDFRTSDDPNMSFKLPNTAMKCSRILFLIYYITFASQEIALCFTVCFAFHKRLLRAGFLFDFQALHVLS